MGEKELQTKNTLFKQREREEENKQVHKRGRQDPKWACTDSGESNVGLKLTHREIMT